MRISDWSSDVCSSDLIRKGVQFHDGKELTVDDVVATLKRHSDENSQSGALGIMNSISDVKADGGDLVVSLPEGNADLPLLMSVRSEEHTSELQSLMRISYAVYRLKKTINIDNTISHVKST